MTTMPKSFDTRTSLNEVRHIFKIAGGLFGDIMISVVWSVEDCTLKAYHQDEEIETLSGMDALNAAKKMLKFGFGPWSQEDQVVTAYIVYIIHEDKLGDAVDTVYQHIHTGEAWTHSGRDLSVYGLSLGRLDPLDPSCNE